MFFSKLKAYFPVEPSMRGRGRDIHYIRDLSLEVRRGTFHSVRPSSECMTIVVDTLVSAFHTPGRLIDSVMQVVKVRNLRELAQLSTQKSIMMEKHFKKVIVRWRNARKAILGFEPNAGAYKFMKDGEEMTVREYYFRTYNKTLEYPYAPGVVVRKEPREVVPIELCEVLPGQPYKKKLPEDYTRDLVPFATLKPQERQGRIQDAAWHYQQSEYIREVGMKVQTSPISVDAKLLAPPSVSYGGGRTADVQRGGWNVKNQQFYYVKPTKKYLAILNLNPGPLGWDDIKHRMSMLYQCARRLGIELVNPPVATDECRGPDQLETVLRKVIAKYNDATSGKDQALNNLVMIAILPQEAAALRAKLKYFGDIKGGFITQCLRQNKFDRANDQYWNNVLLKINARFGGVNSIVTKSPALDMLARQRFMIVGADVGHPGPQVRKPSVASVVFSFDQWASQYRCATTIQNPREEVIEEFGTLMKWGVNEFARSNKGPPANIVIFRDGVSEGEYTTIAEKEIKAIKESLQELWVEKNVQGVPLPAITFIVVGKGHHSLLFPGEPNVDDGKGNCKAGVAVDSKITNPFNYRDSYLQSHAAIQGTSRSSHYIVLEDEIFNSDIDRIQDLAYALCHNYAKATRSVSIPAPVYYADLACQRGPFHIDEQQARRFQFSDNASVASRDSDQFNLDEWKQVFERVHNNNLGRMYFL